jgi:hypothetical protein
MADIEFPSLDYREQVARIERAQEETRKFVAEHHKLIAEEYKLNAEREKLRSEGDKYKGDRFMYPISIALGFLGALLGSAMILAGHFIR